MAEEKLDMKEVLSEEEQELLGRNWMNIKGNVLIDTVEYLENHASDECKELIEKIKERINVFTHGIIMKRGIVDINTFIK